MSTCKEFQKLLALNGIVLNDLGLSDIALLRSHALRGIEILRDNSIPVLGGDVYYRKDGKTFVAFANWHCEPNKFEDINSFAVRSYNSAFEYISKYPNSEDKETVFVLIAMNGHSRHST